MQTKIIKQKISNFISRLYQISTSVANDEESLRLLSFYANFRWNNYNEDLSDPKLEHHLKKMSNKLIVSKSQELASKGKILHVLTSAYDTGGHTRVVYNWIKAKPEQIHDVIINRPTDCIPDILQIAKVNNGKIIINDKTTFVDKAQFLFDEGIKYEYIVLHHHPDDILPILAFGTNQFNRPIFFYDHADHVWGCGYSVCNKILELKTSGIDFCSKYRRIHSEDVAVVGIPIDIKKFEITNKVASTVYKICTISSSYKLKPIEGFNFLNYIRVICDKFQKVEFHIIGVDSEANDWDALVNDYPNRIVLHGVLNHSDMINILTESDLYVDSFPMPSYTSYIEAISYGVPAISLKTPFGVLDSNVINLCSNFEELVLRTEECLSLTRSELLGLARNQYELVYTNHSLESFAKKISTIENIKNTNKIAFKERAFNDLLYVDFLYNVLRHEQVSWKNGFTLKLLLNMSFVNVLRVYLAMINVSKVQAFRMIRKYLVGKIKNYIK